MKTDLIGKKFGRLTITDIPTRGRCVCECECGAIVSRTLYVLKTRNQRRTHWITFNGKTQSMADWSDELGISYTKLRRRLGLGWPVSEALTAP